jgi:hypothetical protein
MLKKQKVSTAHWFAWHYAHICQMEAVDQSGKRSSTGELHVKEFQRRRTPISTLSSRCWADAKLRCESLYSFAHAQQLRTPTTDQPSAKESPVSATAGLKGNIIFNSILSFLKLTNTGSFLVLDFELKPWIAFVVFVGWGQYGRTKWDKNLRCLGLGRRRL